MSNRAEAYDSRDKDGRTRTGTRYYPAVEFRDTESKRVIRKEVNTGSESYNFTVGEKVIVRYLPNQPEEFILGGLWPALIFPGVLTVGGILTVWMGITVRKLPFPVTPTNSQSNR